MDKPTRFFINTEQLPGEVTGRLVAMGKQLLTRFDFMREAGMVGDVWTQRTNEGIIFKLDKSGDVDNVKIFMPIKEKLTSKEKMKKKIETETLLIGIEYTDGLIYTDNTWDEMAYPEFEYVDGWYWPYMGFGTLLCDISQGNLNKVYLIEWETPTGLKEPWEQDNLDSVFYAYCQGEHGPYNRGSDKIEQLQEVVYAENSVVEWNRSIEYFNRSGYNSDAADGSTWVELRDDGDWQCYRKWTKYTESISINGEIVVGPLTYMEDHVMKIGPYNPTGLLLNGEEYNTVTGTRIADMVSMSVDKNYYTYLYGLNTYNSCLQLKCTPEPVPWDEVNENLTSITYSGVIQHTGKICCSGDDYSLYDKTEDYSGGIFDAFEGKCLRIFRYDKINIDGDPISNDGITKDGLVYVYSYYDVVNDYDSGADNVQYGYVFAGVNKVTTVGYPTMGIEYMDEDTGEIEMEYYSDHNIVPGLPDDMYSSILLRAYKKTSKEVIY